jgi:hypothetical protein
MKSSLALLLFVISGGLIVLSTRAQTNSARSLSDAEFVQRRFEHLNGSRTMRNALPSGQPGPLLTLKPYASFETYRREFPDCYRDGFHPEAPRPSALYIAVNGAGTAFTHLIARDVLIPLAPQQSSMAVNISTRMGVEQSPLRSHGRSAGIQLA